MGLDIYAAVNQAAIDALARIKATQRAEKIGNYSRDLYPARAIMQAVCNDDYTAMRKLEIIEVELEKHLAYGLPTQERYARESAFKARTAVGDAHERFHAAWVEEYYELNPAESPSAPTQPGGE